MSILIFNAGSSTLKYRLFRSADLVTLAGGIVSAFGPAARHHWRAGAAQAEEPLAAPDHSAAARGVIDWLQAFLAHDRLAPVKAIGHRVVYGGEEFRAPVRITPDVLARIDRLSPLAPLHNPSAVAVIRAARERLAPDTPAVAVFDTAFHHDLPERARVYALPAEWIRANRIRRYGFHGIAHQYMSERCAELAGAAPQRVITLQLGNGCSVAAIHDGRSIDTSMGYTPLEGLVMSSRCGDVDPGALLQLLAQGMSAESLANGLNRESGLLALSGSSSDMRELLAREAAGDARARLAIEVFCYRARKYVGAYAAALGGVDAVVFGGGIGEHAPAIRARICAGLQWCGIVLDADANRDAIGREARVSDPAGVAVFVVPVNEELLIARETRALVRSGS